MNAKKTPSPNDNSAAREIDAIFKVSGDWRGTKLSHLRDVIKQADPVVVEEVKWKKPSKPSGSPVWSHDGILCIGEVLKSAVRLTFPKGAQMRDPEGLFDTRLNSKSVRAIDFFENDTIDDAAVKELILEAVRVNTLGASG